MLKVDELRAAVADADNFLTKDRTGLVHQHTLDSLRSQLKNRSKSLFGPTAEVDILELDSHAHGRAYPVFAIRVFTDAAQITLNQLLDPQIS